MLLFKLSIDIKSGKWTLTDKRFWSQTVWVVRVWVFWICSSSPFFAIWLGRDVRSECSTKTMGLNLVLLLPKKKTHINQMPYVRITLCTPTFSFSLPSLLCQGSTLSLPVALPIPIVLVLHSPLTSHPSQIAGKWEELRIQKSQTLPTVWVSSWPRLL